MMQGSLAGCDSWFQHPGIELSAHYGIGRKGEIHQYVLNTMVAYHAGSREWNQKSIGIEFAGLYPGKITEAQIESGVWLLGKINTVRELRRHSDVNPAKPQCPGPDFPFDEIEYRWRRTR